MFWINNRVRDILLTIMKRKIFRIFFVFEELFEGMDHATVASMTLDADAFLHFFLSFFPGRSCN